MSDSTEKIANFDRKERIRERYKGINADELEVIHARVKENIRKDNVERRVAVYARVSTDDPNQTSSYELQKNHYTDFVNNHPNWKLVKIYADEGISGTSLRHRDSFLEMIKDCEAGKIDMIITKHVSRFARNIVDCIKIERDLKKLNPPVGVFFETENLFTLDEDSEVLLSIMAMMAQEESHTKSEIMNASIEMRFRRGIFLTPTLLGYDKDENGMLVINEDEAKIVRLIFYMYLYGYTCQQIADTLTNMGRKTKTGNDTWSAGTILQILQNERHCGDVLARKTFTPSYLDHKSRKNRKDRNQYLHRDNHEAIISRDDFIAVQHLIANAKYRNKSILPELQVIPNGILAGYVSVHPRWSGFTASDYIAACESVSSGISEQNLIEVTANTGDFDFRGYEVARAQFFDTQNKLCITFSANTIKFSTEAVRKFGKQTPIEMLVHPQKHLIAVRPCPADSRSKMEWSKVHRGNIIPKPISGNAFLPTLYSLFGWNATCKYRIIGIFRKKDNDAILVFSLSDTEVLIPQDIIGQEQEGMMPFTDTGKNRNVLGYPAHWAENFGSNYYIQAQADELAEFQKTAEWNTAAEGTPYREPEIQPTSAEEIEKNIAALMDEIKQEDTNDRNETDGDN